MTKLITTIVITVLITVAILGAAFYILMPSLATSYMIETHHGGDASAMGGMHAMMMGETTLPENVDLAQTRASTNGTYSVTWSTDSGTPPLNAIHTWTLHVENADGSAAEGVTIAVSGGMPQHGHGLPTQPQMTNELGGGDYLIEGMKFQMPGYWQVIFTITGAETDAVMFELNLQ